MPILVRFSVEGCSSILGSHCVRETGLAENLCIKVCNVVTLDGLLLIMPSVCHYDTILQCSDVGAS